ncbi:MAG TPA: hypothetical protein ENJ53_05390, partial [Phaeodactylibacter sp.]|nr:hypothetical protein [Phaeodactylibacter sp.]
MKNLMIKSILPVVLFLSTTAFVSPVIESNLQKDGVPDVCDASNNTFQDGEKLVYKLYYNWGYLWLSAGELTLTVKDLGEQYYISAQGSTYSSY